MPDRPTAGPTAAGPVAEVVCPGADATRALARALGRTLSGGDVVVLDGPLGAGKTTFVQGLALGLGVTAAVTSPTFVLARHQRPDPAGPRPDGPGLVHVDAYRLDGALELDDLDLDSDLDHAVVVVEWGQGLAERLSPARVEVGLARAARAPASAVPGDGTGDGTGNGTGNGTGDGTGDGTGEEPRTVTVRPVGLGPDRTARLLEALQEAAKC